MTPTLGDQKAKDLGFEAADAAEREGRDGGEDKGTWHWGEVEKRPAKATVRGQSRGRERREVPERQGQATRPPQTQENEVQPHKAGTGLNAGGGPEVSSRSGAVPSLKTDRARSLGRGLRPTRGLEGPAAQSFEHAHSARVVHLGTKALAGAVPLGP